MCSTPFGIRDSTLDVLAEVLSSLGSAQRLSASEIRHKEGKKEENRLISGAQRLSASEIRHQQQQQQKLSYSRAQRLSASEIRHRERAEIEAKGYKCSTPFGIRDSTPCFISEMRAKIFRCSTPFGIRDSTLADIALRENQPFECSTPFGIRDSTRDLLAKGRRDTYSAQRLSASEIRHPKNKAIFLISITRAQRLSASEIRHVYCDD